MAQTLVCILVHVVFSTKNRASFIDSEIEPQLKAYLVDLVKEYDSRCLAINGTEDHIHLLISQSKKHALAEIVGGIKANSSRWIKTKGEQYRNFSWQDGYAAFSIGQSNVERLKEYIANQKEHHRKKSFQEELKKVLNLYGVEYDENLLWK